MAMKKSRSMIRASIFTLLLLLPWRLAALDSLAVRPQRGAPDTLAIVPFYETPHPSVALVLSGGGARGFAHIGALRALERHGIPVDLIVGTSIGAVIGGLYAIGYSPDDLQQVADTTKWDEIVSLGEEFKRRELFVDQKSLADRSLLVLRFEGLQPLLPSSASAGQRYANLIQTLTLQGIYHPDSSFDNLRVRFRAVSTDLLSGRRIVFDHGDLAEALRASATIPILFSPVRKDSMELVDGGLVSNIPVDVAQSLGYTLVVAVNTTSGLRPRTEISAPWQTADQMIDIMMQLPNRLELERASVVVNPRLGNQVSSDFSNADSVIVCGEEAMEKAIPAIEALLASETASHTDPPPLFSRFTIAIDGEGIPAKLRDQILRRHSQAFLSLDEVQRDVNVLYATGGFADVHGDVRWDTAAAGAARVVYTVKENPVLREVRLSGTAKLSPANAAAPLQRLVGKPLNAVAAHHAMDSLLAIYRRRGFSLASIRKITFEAGVASVDIDEGRITSIEIKGNHRTRNYVILREFPLSVGDIFDVNEANRGVRNISSTGLFSIVTLRVGHAEGGLSRHALVIDVEERSPDLIRFAFRADNERNFQPYIDIRDENLFGLGMQLGFTFFGGTQNQFYRIEHKSTRIFNTYFTFNLSGFARLENIHTYTDVPTHSFSSWRLRPDGEYREISYGGNFAFGGQFGRLGNVTAEIREEHHEVKVLEGNAVGPESYTLGALRFSSIIDSRDRVPFPNEGIMMNLSYETALPALWSDIAYTKFYISYEAFTTFGKRATIHPRVVFGFGDKTLPLQEQFSLGGIRSFYGLQEYAFRGRQLFTVNLEYRIRLPFRIFFDTYLSARYDLGAVWQYTEDIRFRDLRHGAGVGAAMDTPIGPAEFAVGKSFLFHRELPDNPFSFGPWELYFAIGIPLP